MKHNLISSEGASLFTENQERSIVVVAALSNEPVSGSIYMGSKQ